MATTRVTCVGIPVRKGAIRSGNGHLQSAIAKGLSVQRRNRALGITLIGFVKSRFSRVQYKERQA